MANIPFSDDRVAEPLFQNSYGTYVSHNPSAGETWQTDALTFPAGPTFAGNDGQSIVIPMTNFRWIDLHFVYQTTSSSGVPYGIDIALVSLSDPGAGGLGPGADEVLIHGPQVVKLISDQGGLVALDPGTKHYILDGAGTIGTAAGKYRFKMRVLATGEAFRVDTYVRTNGTGTVASEWNNPKMSASFIRIAK